MTVARRISSAYDWYLRPDVANGPVPTTTDEAHELAANLLGPKPGQDSFALVAALVARRRIAELESLYAGRTQLHAIVADVAGSRYHDDFAVRLGAPFRRGEAADLHALRALAALGLTLAETDPDPARLRKAVAWYQESRGTSATTSPVRWSPADLAGKDAHLRQRLKFLAAVALPEAQSAAAWQAAMTMRCLAHPTVQPSLPILLYEPGHDLGYRTDQPTAAPGLLGGLRQRVRWLTGRSRSAGLTVLFDLGQEGLKARLKVVASNGLPTGLLPDPERMSLFAADESFQQSLGRAWEQAARNKIAGTLLWSLETTLGPQRYAVGESLGAAFAIVFDEIRRLRQPLASFLAVRRLKNSAVVIGKIDDFGYLQGVEGYRSKLGALGEAAKVIVPQTDYQKAHLAASSLSSSNQPKPELVPVGSWRQAAAKARRSSRSVLIRDCLVVTAVTGVVAASAAISHLSHAASNERKAATFGQVLSAATNFVNTDVSLAANLDIVAYRLRHTPRTYTSLLGDADIPLATQLGGVGAPVHSLAFSPNGRLLATGSAYGEVQLWNVSERGRPRRIGRPLVVRGRGSAAIAADIIYSVAFSPNSRLLATGSDSGIIRLWDVANPAHPTNIEIQQPLSGVGVECVAFSADGTALADGTSNGMVRFWNVVNPSHPFMVGPKIRAGSEAVYSLAFSPVSALLATGSQNGSIQLWNLAGREPVAAGKPHRPSRFPVHSLSFSADGALLVSGGDDLNIRLWIVDHSDRLIQAKARSAGNNAVDAVAINPAGRVAASSNGSAVQLWTVTDVLGLFAFGQPLTGSTGSVDAITFSPTGNKLAVGSSDGTTRLWTLPPTLLSGNSAVESEAFDSNGRVLVSGNEDGTIQLWNLATPGRPRALGPSVQDNDGTALTSVAFNPDGRVLAGGSSGGTLELWRLSDQGKLSRIGQPYNDYTSPIVEVAFSRRRQLLAIGYYNGTIQLWNVANPAHLVALTGHVRDRSGAISALAFSPNSRTLAAGTATGGVLLWNVNNPRQPVIGTAETITAGDTINTVQFSPRGNLLETGGIDGTINFWTVRYPAQAVIMGRPLINPYQVWSAAFSPNGRTLAVGFGNGAAGLWAVSDPRKPVELGRLQLAADTPFPALAFSPNGHVVALAGEDGVIRLLPTNTSSAIRWICSATAGVLTKSTWQRIIPALPYTPPCDQ